MLNFIYSIKLKLLKIARRIARRIAINSLKANKGLWSELKNYQAKSKSTGCSWSDLWILYKTVRERKPKDILELGPGVSTLVMSYALMENEKEGFPGKITAMEELEKYLNMATSLQPDFLSKYVNFVLSPRIEDTFELFRGVRYQDVPDLPYDFIFVDGPHHHAPSDDAFVFDFDLIHIIKNTTNSIYAIIDYRLTTSYVFQTILGLDKAKFNSVLELCFVGPCSKDDLLQLNLEDISKTLLREARLFGNTKIKLK